MSPQQQHDTRHYQHGFARRRRLLEDETRDRLREACRQGSVPEHRSIYGEASPDQAKELHDEGIEFHPLPVLPDERN
jgi:hypothetical protein